LADWDAEYGVQADGDLSLPFYLDRRSHLLYGFLYHKLSTSIAGSFAVDEMAIEILGQSGFSMAVMSDRID
jgi:hypothetical protein